MFRTSMGVKLALGILLGALALSACAGPTTLLKEPQPRTISVTGTGIAYGAPDIAVAQIGVQSRDGDPARAVEANNQKMSRIIEALGKLGVEARDIQTSNFSVSAQQDYDPETGRALETITYLVDNTVAVTVREPAKLGEVLGQTVSNGANSIYGVNFSLSDSTALTAEARDKAMADAKARADQLAAAAGVSVVRPMTIGEFSSGPVFAADMAYGKGGGAGPVPVAVGQYQITMQVSVVYEIK